MSVPKLRKFIKRFVILMTVFVVIILAALVGGSYYLKSIGVTYSNLDYDFPGTLTIENLKFENDVVLLTSEYTQANIRLKNLLKVELSGRYLEARNMYIFLKPDDPTDTSTFELSDLILIHVDTVVGSRILYKSKDGLDSMVVDLPVVYAQNFDIDNGFFTDTIYGKNGSFTMSLPDTTETTDTVSAMADLMKIAAQQLVLENASVVINYPKNQQYKFSEISTSLTGLNSENPIDVKANYFDFVFQDSIKLASKGDEFSISPAGDLDLEEFNFSTPHINVQVRNIGITAKDRYYANIKHSRINSNFIKKFVPNLPLANNTNVLFNGGIAWDKDSIILDDFEIDLDEKTKLAASGYAIYKNSLVETNINFSRINTTLYELQRLFGLDTIEGQKDIEIVSNFLVSGNLEKLTAKGNATLNQNNLAIETTYSEKDFEMAEISVLLNSKALSPQHIVTAAPEDLSLQNFNLQSQFSLDSSFALKDLQANMVCGHLVYSNYRLTNFTALAEVNTKETSVEIKANERNFYVFAQTQNNVFSSDSIFYTGRFNSEIPTLTDFKSTAGLAESPFSGSFVNSATELSLNVLLDSLNFTPDSAEKSYTNQIEFSYASDTTYGIAIDLDIDTANIFYFKGDPQTFDWLAETERDTLNYPYFKTQMHLRLDSNLFEILTGERGAVNIKNLQVETAENAIELKLNSPWIEYSDYKIANAQANFSTNLKTYGGKLLVDSLENPYANLNTVNLSLASVQANKTTSQWSFNFSEFNESVAFGIDYLTDENSRILKFIDGQPIQLGTQKWEVSNNEGVWFNPKWELIKSEFILNNKQEKIEFKTENDIIDLAISNFKIEPIYALIFGDTAVGGLFTLGAEYKVEEKNLVWNGSLDSIYFDTISIGTFTTQGKYTTQNFEAHQELAHQNSLLHFDVTKKENAPFLYELDLKNFELASLNVLYNKLGFDGEVSGNLDGNLKGDFDDYTSAIGYLHFNNVKAQLQEFGMYFLVENSNINIENEAFVFNNFTLKDKIGQPLVINGNILLDENKRMQLDVNAKQFMVLDQPDQRKKYWGKVNISTKLVASGSRNKLTIKGYLNLLKESNIGYKYRSTTTINRLDDEIVFTSFSDTTAPAKVKKKRKDGAKISWDVDLNFGRTKLYVLLSEVGNDYVRMTASGKLALKTGQNQIPEVYGKIESKEGSIFYDAPVVSDLNLKIEHASIAFNGDIERPSISFIGTEVFRVSTNEITGQGNKKGAMVPVEVIAKVDESPLDEFDLEFDLHSDNGEMGSFIDGLPQSTRETYAMNLLVFGTLTQEDQKGNTAMRAVVSKLNEISRRNLKSADLTFYVDTEENVDVNNMQGVNTIGYDFSKEFFKDKVRVTVGGEVVLETYVADGRKKFNPLGNVEIDYLFREDPDLSVSVSKKDSYLGPVDGQVDQYSVGFSFSQWFRNIFYKQKAKKEDE